MMKAVWKKLIAVAFCGATAASMLSVGASAYSSSDLWYNQNVIPYGINAQDSRSTEYWDEKDNHWYYDDVYLKLKAENWKDGLITATINKPSWVTIDKITWSGDGYNENTVNNDKDTEIKVLGNVDEFNVTCTVSFSYSYTVHGDKRTVTGEVDATVKSNHVWKNEEEAKLTWSSHVTDNSGGYYNDKWYDRHDWDYDKIYWDGDYYWYYSGGRWHATTSYPGLPDWDRPSRPSYSKEYEVDWSDDTFYYNGKVQMPSATVTIGGRTIELDVKLISGDGTSVGRHRVRASLPSRYSRYDLTGTTLYYEIEEPEKDGFVTENGNTYYYDNGRKVTGWQTINGSRYYFLDNGEAADGWVKDGPADWYYFSDGKMQTGWINDNGTTYYCYGTGKMCHGRWHEIAGKWYYFNESGAMLTSQWILDKGNWYYVAGDGVMATNTTVPGGYRVNASGVWVK